MGTASAQQAKLLRNISAQEGGLQRAEQRVLNLRIQGFGPKVISGKTGFPQWFVDRVLNVPE